MFGSVLDVPGGMKPFTSVADDDLTPESGDLAPIEAGKISPAAKTYARHILVVDDEPLIRWSVSESLTDLGYDVEEACDAASALRMVTGAALPFDVVVLDLRLPDMDDLSLLATLRQVIPGATMILMTAFGTPEVVAEAMALGAEVINKPFELDDLRRLVLGSEPKVS